MLLARQMRTSDKGVELIQSFEGFRARASRLPDGKWLVGYGHTETARAGLTVSAFDAELILRFHDLKRIENHLAQQVFTPLSQNEFDALVSFAFNIGLKAFDSSDVLAHLNSGDRILAAEAMSSWRRGRVDGQIRVIDGLVRRRAVEVATFLDTPKRRVSIPSALVRPERDGLAGPNGNRDTSIVLEPRPEQNRARATAERESPPEAAARAVAQRLTRILGENGSRASGEPDPQPTGDSTVDEITRAVSALAGPEGNGEPAPAPPASMSERRRAYRPPNLSDPQGEGLTLDNLSVPPTSQKLIDDLATVEVDTSRLITPAQAEIEDFAPAHGWRWLPFALLAGLGTIGLYDGLRRILTQSGARMGEAASQTYTGPLMALGGGFLLFVSVYYLYRMLAQED
jgi:lysozyme